MISLEEENEMTSTGIIATMLNPLGWADSENGAYPYTEHWSIRSPIPILKKGEALQFVPQLMQVGRPYPFQFIDWWFVAVKRSDDALDFFHIGSE